MNIYGHLKKANEVIEKNLSFQTDEINPMLVVKGIRDSWIFIEKYIKNVYPIWTQELNDRLKNIDLNDLAFSVDMRKESNRLVVRIIQERDVKNYFSQYISLVENLLIFSKTYEESCDRCQGGLRYYTDEKKDTVFKMCKTCGGIFSGKSGERIELDK